MSSLVSSVWGVLDKLDVSTVLVVGVVGYVTYTFFFGEATPNNVHDANAIRIPAANTGNAANTPAGRSPSNILIQQITRHFNIREPVPMMAGANNWNTACARAKSLNRPILLYIHDELPQVARNGQTDWNPIVKMFCQTDVMDVIRENYVNYVCIAGMRESQILARTMKINRFPFLCVLDVFTRNNKDMIVNLWSVPNVPMSSDEFLRVLINMLDKRADLRDQTSNREFRRTVEQRQLQQQRDLKQAQDNEYLQALQEDKDKKNKDKQDLELKKKQEEEERTRKIQEQQQIKEEEEAHETNQLERASERERKRALLPAEPTTDKCVNVRLKLCSGSSVQRSFPQDCVFDEIFLWVESLDELYGVDGEEMNGMGVPGGYQVVSAYPRKIFMDGGLKVMDAVGKSCALMIEDIACEGDYDDDEDEGDDDDEGDDER